MTGRVFGFSMSAGYLGIFIGSILGGQIAAWIGLRAVFIATGAILLLNAVWVYTKAYKKLNRITAVSR
ncbi:drug efflux system protein MdtG [compost metagenome]